MGPELPQDPVEDQLNAPPIQHPIIATSDDSDNETMDAYEGYQPLAMDDGEQQQQQEGPDNMETNGDVDLMQEPVTHGDPNMPHIESIDAEVERQVWNEPRPRELQIELDNTRTEQILTAMAGFTLPNVAVPDWAAGVPEERWKDELLQRIRQRKDVKTDNNGVSPNSTEINS